MTLDEAKLLAEGAFAKLDGAEDPGAHLVPRERGKQALITNPENRARAQGERERGSFVVWRSSVSCWAVLVSTDRPIFLDDPREVSVYNCA